MIMVLFSKLDQIVSALQSSLVDYLVVFGTLGAVIAALAIAIWGEAWKRLPKTSIIATNVVTTSQAQGDGGVLLISRVAIKNVGKRPISNLRCNMEVIEHRTGETLTIRPNFVPVPLNWMHYSDKREIAIHETALLDVIQHVSSEDDYRICWPNNILPYEPSLSRISLSEESVLHLVFYATDALGEVKLLLNKFGLKVLNDKPMLVSHE